MAKTYNASQLIITHPEVAQADLEANRFVGYDGNYCGAGAQATGVTPEPYETAENIAVIIGGTALLELGATVSAVETPLKSDSTGRGVPTSQASIATYPILAFALDTGVVSDIIKVRLSL